MKTLLRENELKVPEEVGALVRDARYRFHKGEVHELAGHATLTRLKVAAGLMWLDGRTDKISAGSGPCRDRDADKRPKPAGMSWRL